MITAGVAALAAVFFILDFENPGDETTSAWMHLIQPALAVAVTALYGLLSIRASTSLIGQEKPTGAGKIRWKRDRTRNVLMAFWPMLAIKGFPVFIPDRQTQTENENPPVPGRREAAHRREL